MWTVRIKRKLERQIEKLPVRTIALYMALKQDLADNGPEQPSWKNYSKLTNNRHHCHLGYHYVACWQVLSETELELEVYYVGSRENAPYAK